MALDRGRTGRVVAGAKQGKRVLYGFEMDVVGKRPPKFASETLRWESIVNSLRYAAGCVGFTNKGLFTTLTECQAYAMARREIAKETERQHVEQQELELGGGVD